MYEIKPNPLGYYTLYIEGVFAGNFDTKPEAERECDIIMSDR